MTVSELIEQLKNYPSDMRVLTLGYEGGYDDIDIKTEPVVFNVNSKDTWFFGRHESAKTMPEMTDNSLCVIITRTA